MAIRDVAVRYTANASSVLSANAKVATSTRAMAAEIKSSAAQASAAQAGMSKASTKSAAEVRAAFQSAEASAERSTQRLVASLRAQEAEMVKAAAAAQKYGKSTAFLTSHKEQLDKVATGLAGIGVAAAVGFGAATKETMDFQAEMAKVSAFSDDARKHITALTGLAKQFTPLGYSATQAAQAEEELVKAGVSAKDMINGGLKGALALAAAGQIDVSRATEIASAAMTQFGLKGKDIPHVADLLAAGADKALGGVSDLGEALSYSGTQAHQYGISINDTVGVLAEFASQGQLGSKAGTEFSQVLARLGAPTQKAAAQMKAVGLNVYDANGNFVDMTTLAGRLSKSFDKLSPAARNSAEQIIFGQRAIQGANVLIAEGAKGTQDWINKVNDQGFAAQTASRKLDSLAGDLQKLKAAGSNALVDLGTGDQSGLRGLVQDVTKLVVGFDNLSPGMKGFIDKGLLVTAGAGLAGAGFIKLTTSVAGTKKALIDLGAPKIISGIKGLASTAASSAGSLTAIGLAAGPAAVAIGLGVAALVKWEQKQQDIKQSTSGFDSVLDTMTGKVDANTAALNKNVQQQAIKQLNDAGAYRSAAQLGISYNDVTQAALGNVAAQKRIAAVTGDVIGKQHEGSLAAAGYATANKDSSAAVGQNAGAARKLNDVLGTTTSGLHSAVRAHDDYVKATKQATSATNGGAGAVTKSSSGIAKAAATLTGTLDDLGVSTSSVKTNDDLLSVAATEVGKQIQSLESKFTILNGGMLSAAQASDQYKDSLSNLTSAVKSNGTSLNDNTTKGRANREAIEQSISAMNDSVKAQFTNEVQTKGLSKATDDSAKSLKQQKQDLINQATQAGLNRSAVKKMVDQMVLTPKQLRTEIKQSGAQDVEKQIKMLQREIDALSGKKVDVSYSVTANGTPIRGAAARTPGGHNVAISNATGGFVSGPGTATSDSILSWLSDGEFVVNAKSTQKNRGLLEMINADKHADGGIVTAKPPVSYQFSMPAGSAAALHVLLNAAEKSAEASAKEQMLSVPAAGGGSSVARWAPLILKALQLLGQPSSLLGAVEHRMAQESGGNPTIVNHWDANAAAGHPSQGLMQTIPGTFAAYAGPYRSRGILDPFANIYAGLNYALHNYPSLYGAMTQSGGYRNGTNNATPGVHIVGEDGPEAILFAGGEKVIPHMALGGPVKAAEFGSSTSFSVAQIVALIRGLKNPVADLAAATRALKAAEKNAGMNLSQATRAYSRTVAEQKNLRLDNAEQTERARTQVAAASAKVTTARLALQKLAPANSKIGKAQSGLTSAESSLASKRRSDAEAIAKLEDKIADAKKGSATYQNLITEKQLKEKSNTRDIAAAQSKVNSARKTAEKAGVNTDKITRAEKRLTDAENALTKARAHQSTVSRENSLQTAQAAAAVSKAKAKVDSLKTATDALTQAQQQVADSAKATSDAFSGLYNQPAGSITDLFKSMQTGAKQIGTFSKQIDQLRKKGLSESIIDQIMQVAQSQGIAAGSKLAGSVGGAGAIRQLNQAAQALQDAADIIGYHDATAKKRATGGLVYGPGGGTSDKVRLLASNGEFVQSTAAVQYYGLSAMRAMNQRQIPRNYLQGQSGTVQRTVVTAAQPGSDRPMRLEGTLDMGNGLKGYVQGVLVSTIKQERDRT